MRGDHAHRWFIGVRTRSGAGAMVQRPMPPGCDVRSVMSALSDPSRAGLDLGTVWLDGPHYAGSREFENARRGALSSDGIIESVCRGEMDPNYVQTTLDEAGENVGVIIASAGYKERRRGGVRECSVPVGYAVVTRGMFGSVSYLQIDLLCGGVPGAGIGAQILDYCTEYARREGLSLLRLNSVHTKVDYYMRRGFTRTGVFLPNADMPALTEMTLGL